MNERRSQIPQAAEVPGFVLVPREPTMEMLLAAVECPGREGMRSVYRAMLAAAPTPTASAAKAEGETKPSLTERLQQKCSDWNTYWRASDAHGVILSPAQAVELLQDALGVEVEITQPPSEADRTREGGDVVAPFDRLAINPTHEAADAFWTYWRENGETHKHGYYESTWGAINRALRVAGVRLHNYGEA